MNNYNKDSNEEIKLLDIQIIVSVITIITIIISITLIYNQKLDLQNKDTLFSKNKTQKISLINRITLVVTASIFLYINYKLKEISVSEGEDTKPYNLQIISSYLTVIASIIVLYVVANTYNIENVSDVENPVI